MLLNSNRPLQGGEIKEMSCRCLVAVWRFVGAGTLPNRDWLCWVFWKWVAASLPHQCRWVSLAVLPHFRWCSLFEEPLPSSSPSDEYKGKGVLPSS